MFCFRLKELGGGGILDLGVYALQLVQYVFRGYQLQSTHGHGHLNEYGVDDMANAILTYSDGRSAVITCSTKLELANEAIIIGTKGIIKVSLSTLLNSAEFLILNV